MDDKCLPDRDSIQCRLLVPSVHRGSLAGWERPERNPERTTKTPPDVGASANDGPGLDVACAARDAVPVSPEID